MKNRNIGLCLVLSIVTCGIYGIYWLYHLVVDSHELYGVPYIGDNAILMTVLCCTPVVWYWLYITGQAIEQKKNKPNQAILYIILGIVGLGIVDYCLIQNEINQDVPAAQ
jgi:hypothetical protein